MIKKILLLAIVISMFGCAGKKPKDDLDYQTRFDRGMKFLEKKKYLRAQEEFNRVVISGSHTDLGDDAQFYLGEAYFLNKEYLLAIAEFDRLTRRMSFSPFVEKARWRICESYVAESPKYYHDQSYTNKALDKLQEFLDDYPNSEFGSEANQTIDELRYKLGKKAYETGILYIKLGAYDSAINAFNDLLGRYYDTDFAQQARVGIVRSYCLSKDTEAAKLYLASNLDQIPSKELKSKAQSYIEETQRKIDKKKK